MSIHKETSKGTKKMIEIIYAKKEMKSGIIIKFPKKKPRFKSWNLPTIGLETLKDCKKANLKGIVLRSNQNIFLDQRNISQFC